MSSSPSSMSDQRLISWVLEARLFLQYLQDIQYSLDRELECKRAVMQCLHGRNHYGKREKISDLMKP